MVNFHVSASVDNAIKAIESLTAALTEAKLTTDGLSASLSKRFEQESQKTIKSSKKMSTDISKDLTDIQKRINSLTGIGSSSFFEYKGSFYRDFNALTKDMTKSFQEQNAAVKTLKSSFSDISGFKEWSQGIDGASSKTSSSIKYQTKSIDELAKEVGDWEKETSKASDKQKSLSESTDKATSSQKKLKKEVNENSKVFMKANSWVDSYVGNLAAMATTTAFSFLKRQIRSALGEAIEFDKLITQIKVLAPNINKEAFSSELLNKSIEFGLSARDAADAMVDIASSGSKTPTKMFTVLGESAKLGVGYMANIKESVKATIGVMNSFGTTTEDLSKNSDIMAQIIDQGIVRFSEIGRTIGQVAPLAANTGIEFRDLGAGLAHFTKQGAPFSTAAVSAKQAISNLISPTVKSQKMLDALGVKVDADTLAMDGLSGSISKLNNATGGSVKFMNTFNGNIRASQYTMTQTGRSTSAYSETLKQFQNVTGKSEKAFIDMSNTIDFQTKQVSSAFNVGIIQGVLPIISTLRDSLLDLDKKEFAEELKRGIWDFSIDTVDFLGRTQVAFLELQRAVATVGGAFASAGADVFGTLTFGETSTKYKESANDIANTTKKVLTEIDSDIQKSVINTDKTLNRLKKNISDYSSQKLASPLATEEQQKDMDILNTKNKKLSDSIADSTVKTTERHKTLQDVIDDLQKEEAMLNKNNIQQKTYNSLSQLGLDVTKYRVDEEGKIYDSAGKVVIKYQEMVDIIKQIDEEQKRIKPWWNKQIDSMKDFGKNYADQMITLGDVTMNAFQSMEDGIIEFAKTGKFSFSDFVNSAIEDLSRLMIQQQLMGFATGISGMFSSPTNSQISIANGTNGNLFATGGYISGAGNGTSDSIPARLSNGEFVINAKSTEKYRPMLEQMNKNKFADGGIVGAGRSSGLGGTDIQIIDQRGAGAPPIQSEQSTGPDGTRMIRMLVKTEVKKGIADGSFDKANNNAYGLRRSAYRR